MHFQEEANSKLHVVMTREGLLNVQILLLLHCGGVGNPTFTNPDVK